MKIRLLVVSCLVFFLVFSCKKINDKESSVIVGNMRMSKKPERGGKLTIHHSSEEIDYLDNEFTAYYYTIVDQNIYPQDIEMVDTDEGKKTEILIPDSATAIAFSFKSEDNYDTNDNLGYVFTLHEGEKRIPGSLAAKANFHLQMDKNIGIEIQTDSVLDWLKTDIEEYPNIEMEWQEIYAKTLLAYNPAKGKEYVRKRLIVIENKNQFSEEDYKGLIFLYDQLQKKEERDSIEQLAIDKYKRGEIAQNALFDKFKRAETHEERKEIFKEYQIKIGKGGKYKDKMLNQLIQYVLQSGESDEITNYINNYSDEQIRDTYARVLYEKGELSNALKEQEKAIGDGGFPEINEHYIQYLLENKDYDKAEKKASEFIASGNTTEELIYYFKQAYVQNNGSDKGYKEKLVFLEGKAFKKVKDALISEMIDAEAPDISLTDSSGKSVKLSELEGKTIILDFWATWCGPCIKSFPGMERAMEYFKGDDNVQFYYVNTFERESGEVRRQKVDDFISKHNYAFEILYDEFRDGNFITARNFGITGIPTKIIIGPDGRWKFTKEGYDGDNDKLLYEIRALVELTQH